MAGVGRGCVRRGHRRVDDGGPCQLWDVRIALHVIGIALIAGRILQSWNMWSTEVAGFGRQSGQSLTWLSIIALAVLNLWKLV